MLGESSGFTGSIQSEAALIEILERYEITRERLVSVRVNGRMYPPSTLDHFFEKVKAKEEGECCC
ncbi:hypothetical protein GFC29_3102 [Anoxybacillus sp. B7M1]|uniref:hypothetical protein n=1 Tax=unclassified Anoxybacillus TaxID=2639704 RepID=UPI0007B584E2|nr:MULTISPECIES: hypothetical protein [unclassified Anoxybacillus]ANB55922.1 hypothetical protein GFC28_2334 [Anoxybacillus sp. B2M1]ANB64080.1 hypothetical protein GFC29_3102 [Anoxybacillus sp. B7M1]